jgi:O-succinylbenzoic acid--CoA ligase
MCCAERDRRPRRFPLEIRAARTPEALALVCRPGALPGPATREGALTFAELERWTGALARLLRERGVGRGERVGLLLPAGPAYPVLLLALLRAGAVAVPVSARLPRATVPGLLERVGCRRLVADVPALPGSAPPLRVDDAGELLHASRPRSRAAAAADDGPPLPAFDRGADATIVFTSGSTGTPKAALHTFENHWASAIGSNRNLRLRPGDRWLLSLPPWHVGGLGVIFRCLLGGAAIAVAAKEEPLAAAIAGLGATHVSLVVTQLHRLMREEHGRTALRGLKAILLGGGPIPAALAAAAAQAGAPLITSYGSTEMSSQVTSTRPGDPPAALATAGRRLAGRELSVAADGEILVRGRTLFHGYLDGERVRSAQDAAGWFATGDLGRLDADGRLVVTGRRDTMFVSGGENIHPEEIEREILRFPGVLEAIVVPVPDAEFGERPAAFLHTADGEPPAAAELELFLRETLPGFKVPRRYLPWPEGAAGLKPDRRSLAARAREPEPRAGGAQDPVR